MTKVAHRIIEDENAAYEARQKAWQEQKIQARTQELLRVNGTKYGFNPKKAREQAIKDVVGPAPYEDDVNEQPESPDRYKIQAARKLS